MSGADQEQRIASFIRLTTPYQARLLRIARSLCRDPDQAADLTQEALVRAFRAFDSFRPGEPILPWLSRILRNVHLDSVKSGRARYEVPAHRMEGEEADPYALAPSPAPSPLDLAERSQLTVWLTEEIERLEPGHRLIVILCDVEDFSYEEAAATAGVPVGTVRSRLSRTRELLRRRLQERMAHQREKNQ